MSLYHALAKRAYAPPANPYGNILPAAPAAAPDWQTAPGVKAPTDTSGSWFQKNVVDNPWIEGAAGLSTMIPGIGGVINGAWQGGRAAYHTAQGNYGKAGQAAAWGAAGFIPGGAVLRGAQLGLGAAKAVKAGQTAMSGVKAVRAAGEAAKWAVPTAQSVSRGAKTVGFGKSLAGGALDVGAAASIGAAIPNYGPGSQYAANNAAVKPVTDMASYGANMLSQGIDENRNRAVTPQ
jgi:hypothetical protein